ncbi:MAG: caspase family protein [Elusimicrobia bacterium]|nr:caspase family protein [Elusimicrobiota bacterium]
MPAPGGRVRPPAYAVVFDRFRDERSSRATLGQYDRGGKGGFLGTVTVVADSDVTEVFEGLVQESLGRKGILTGPSPFVLSGTIRQVGVGATPDSRGLRAQAYLELALTDSNTGSRLWQKSFLGSGSGVSPKATLALAFQDLAGALDRDDSLLAFKRPFLAAGGVVPEAPAAQASAAPRPIESDVDAPPALGARTDRKAYAVVVGIEQYRQSLPRADFAERDARAVTDYLKALGYPPENVVTLLGEHAAKSDLEKYFEQWLPANAGAGSTVFVYYSGHGAPNAVSGDAYLVPYDGDPSFLEATGFPLKRLYADLGRLPSRQVLVAVDSCFSGAGGRSVLAKGARPLVTRMKALEVPSKVTVLAASAAEQVSSSYDEQGHGLFTYFLLKGIRERQGLRADGTLDFPALYGYLKPRVQALAREKNNSEQTPALIGGGD